LEIETLLFVGLSGVGERGGNAPHIITERLGVVINTRASCWFMVTCGMEELLLQTLNEVKVWFLCI